MPVMGRGKNNPMRAIDAFEKNLDRARELIALHKRLGPKGRPVGSSNDLLRAAVVLTVSAVDSYFHDQIPTAAMVLIHSRSGSRLPGKLVEVFRDKDTGLSHEKFLELLYRDRPDEELRRVLKAHLGERTIQGPGQIESNLRILGIDNIWRYVARRLQMSERAAKQLLTQYVKRRDQIAHEADRYRSKKHRHKLRPIHRKYAGRCVKDIQRVVLSVDAVMRRHLPNLP